MQPIPLILGLVVIAFSLRWAVVLQITIFVRAITGKSLPVSDVKIDGLEVILTVGWTAGAILATAAEWKPLGMTLFIAGFVAYLVNLGWKTTSAYSRS